ncbi:hypothetical protein MAR_012588, partial [Mya arenaria]
TEINQYLDKRENELLPDIDQKKRTSKTLLDELKSKCTNMKSSIEKLKSELQAQDDNSNQLLIVGKRAIKELAGLQAALEDGPRNLEDNSFRKNNRTVGRGRINVGVRTATPTTTNEAGTTATGDDATTPKTDESCITKRRINCCCRAARTTTTEGATTTATRDYAATTKTHARVITKRFVYNHR